MNWISVVPQSIEIVERDTTIKNVLSGSSATTSTCWQGKDDNLVEAEVNHFREMGVRERFSSLTSLTSLTSLIFKVQVSRLVKKLKSVSQRQSWQLSPVASTRSWDNHLRHQPVSICGREQIVNDPCSVSLRQPFTPSHPLLQPTQWLAELSPKQ